MRTPIGIGRSMLPGLFVFALAGCGATSPKHLSEAPPDTGRMSIAGIYDVRNFGAVGDGKTDDAKAIQTAVDSAGGLVYFSKGVYRLSKTVIVNLDAHGPTSLSGDGAARIVMDGPGPAFQIIGTHGGTAEPKSLKPEIYDHQRMPIVQGLEITATHADADGLEISGTMQLVVTRVNIHDCRHAIHLTHRNRNIVVSDSNLYHNRAIGIFYDNVNLHQSNITGCHISYNGGGGVVSRGGEVRNIQIAGCDIEANMDLDPKSAPAANLELDSRGGSVAEVAITGCTLQHTNKAPRSCNIHIIGQGEDVQGPTLGFPAKTREGNVTITGNVMSEVQISVYIEHARGIAVVGNTFWEGWDHDMLVENSNNIVAGLNTFERNPRYDRLQKVKPKQGVVFKSCQDCTLSGLQIFGVHEHPAALHLMDCRRFLISGCSILDSDGIGLLMENVSDSRVSGCLISDDRRKNDYQAIVDQGGHGNVVDGH